jgi:hypothetical protein
MNGNWLALSNKAKINRPTTNVLLKEHAISGSVEKTLPASGPGIGGKPGLLLPARENGAFHPDINQDGLFSRR